MRIQHVGLVVSDLDRSRAFYAGPLGSRRFLARPTSRSTARGSGSAAPRLHLLSDAHATVAPGSPIPGRERSVG